MRSAVVFYSLEGNTRVAAEALAQALGAELFEIRTERPYPRRGLAKYLVGGKDSTLGKLPAIEPIDMDPADYDLVVIACPVWAGKAAAPMSSFIRGRDFSACRMALMVASASGNVDSCVRDLSAKLGKTGSDLPALSLTNPGKASRRELTGKTKAFAESLTLRWG